MERVQKPYEKHKKVQTSFIMFLLDISGDSYENLTLSDMRLRICRTGAPHDCHNIASHTANLENVHQAVHTGIKEQAIAKQNGESIFR